ncbi:hypothetical protein H112_01600 [Trichophyton rubrum D6]|uniref:Uncharacterized protein n=3 Tax=Trichophyton TaxID=5550 RepID=F2SXD9_TRIRC|nr:uncharacterized protein TERG_07234 [Trichophyton rubrum CBS 118892]EZF26239.1 hypothetical protein H100_01597 [Trichophyton rubrum MR850]EZF45276.1 hypothetical protein H102_01591 [Trichophyton rubrum CBS 100081]EZF55980.1 hypothetical protein H103_01604 [Trichophyton rubrum CBS 288.86]EZF66679.1 hypothetical protein H104_01579 [Trichophyton rubrum CBS 289.86]EZF77289.1 hypothetical protein H105_01607 [Trichophyton soudanense CBS 452.61]EZF87827.1 hypothetical protein H110_01600 [Trichophy
MYVCTNTFQKHSQFQLQELRHRHYPWKRSSFIRPYESTLMSTPVIHRQHFNQRSQGPALLQTLPTSQHTLHQSHSSLLAPNYSINIFFHAYTPVLRGYKLCDQNLFLVITRLRSQDPLDRSTPLCYHLKSCRLFKNRWLGVV